MKRKVYSGLSGAFAGVAALIVLSACGAPAQEGDTVNEKVFTYQGAPLHCVRDGLGNQATMSCDFVRWHAENDNK